MQLVNGKEFSEFATNRIMLWSQLVGTEVRHDDWGVGHITSVEQRLNYIPLIGVEFRGEAVMFNSDSFRSGKAFLLIDTQLAEEVAAWVVERDEIERGRAEQERREAERREEEDRARNQVIDSFRQLAEKYNVPTEDLWEEGAISPLGAILEKLEDSQSLEDTELEWIEGRRLHRLLATIYYRRHRRTGDVWDLVKTCSNLRKAELPEKVISVTDDVSVCEIPNKHALSALWTTRGGAFRDLNDLAAAERAAADAIRESPTSYHPHNLLGAVMYEMGRPAEGDEHFAEATRLGSAPRNQDSEIRQALRRSSPEARRKVVEYLLAKDPAKYSWARRFAE